MLGAGAGDSNPRNRVQATTIHRTLIPAITAPISSPVVRSQYQGSTNEAAKNAVGRTTPSIRSATEPRGIRPADRAPSASPRTLNRKASPTGNNHGAAAQVGPATNATLPAIAAPPASGGRCRTIRYRPTDSSTNARMRNGNAAAPSRYEPYPSYWMDPLATSQSATQNEISPASGAMPDQSRAR